jgi:hypothetical protein
MRYKQLQYVTGTWEVSSSNPERTDCFDASIIFFSLSLTMVDQTVTILTCIQTVLGLNLVWNTNYHGGVFLYFSQPVASFHNLSI